MKLFSTCFKKELPFLQISSISISSYVVLLCQVFYCSLTGDQTMSEDWTGRAYQRYVTRQWTRDIHLHLSGPDLRLLRIRQPEHVSNMLPSLPQQLNCPQQLQFLQQFQQLQKGTTELNLAVNAFSDELTFRYAERVDMLRASARLCEDRWYSLWNIFTKVPGLYLQLCYYVKLQ